MATQDEVITLMYNVFPNLDFKKTESETRNGENIDVNANLWSNYGPFLQTTYTGSYSEYSRGYYTDGTTGYRVDVTGSRIRINLKQAAMANPLEYRNYQVGMFMVSDGGTTLSSQQDPAINANNPAAPINNVSAANPATLSLLGLSLMGLSFRRRAK
jgi:hypothetical protein